MYNLRITIWKVDDKEDANTSQMSESANSAFSQETKIPGLNTLPPDF